MTLTSDRNDATRHSELPVEQLRLLLDITTEVSEAQTFSDALARALQRLCLASHARRAECWLPRKDDSFESGPGWDAAALAPPSRGLARGRPEGDLGLTFAIRAAKLRRAIWSDDDAARDDAARAVDSADGTVTSSWPSVAIPVLLGSDIAAVFLLFPSDPNDRTGLELASAVCARLGRCLSNKLSEIRTRTNETHFRLLVEHVGDAVFMLDPMGLVETWTPAAQRIFGYSHDEIIGKQLSCFYSEESRATSAAECELRMARETGRYEIDDWRVRRDGTAFWAHIVTCPIRDGEGRNIGYAKIVRDLTLVREAEDARSRYEEALQRSNRELEGFASIASHDLQEPLRKILAFGDRLKRHCGAALDEKGRDYLERMHDSTRRMQSLVDDLLSYSRVTGRAEPLRMVDLQDSAREVLRDLESRIEQCGGVVEVGPLPSIEADSIQIRQLLQNLLANALKFQPAGARPCVKIYGREISPMRERLRGSAIARWEIVVEDNGIGFDEKYADRIFGMLQRLHGRHEYQGTGMGLAICKKIVERYGGTIAARSVPGAGSTFIVMLPAKQPTLGGMTVCP